jgi:hypothetical protein
MRPRPFTCRRTPQDRSQAAEGVEHAIIVDVEATPARTFDEVAATKTMIERTERRLDLKPKRLAADTAYGTARFLAFVAGAGIAPHIPIWDKSTREDGTFSRSDFRWDKRRGVYICANKQGAPHQRHRARRADPSLSRFQARLRCLCTQSALLPKSTRKEIPRDVRKDARDAARRQMRARKPS